MVLLLVLELVLVLELRLVLVFVLVFRLVLVLLFVAVLSLLLLLVVFAKAGARKAPPLNTAARMEILSFRVIFTPSRPVAVNRRAVRPSA
ncbi:MAG: hypothetical protein M3N68_01365 [Actinomycetota bacterium]|nr:hypothetical protein [Actinomycetota bacterium]